MVSNKFIFSIAFRYFTIKVIKYRRDEVNLINEMEKRQECKMNV
jgi:hypothetical protein